MEVENVINKINKEFNPYVEIHKNIITNKMSYKEEIKTLRLKLSELNGQQLNEGIHLCIYSLVNWGYCFNSICKSANKKEDENY